MAALIAVVGLALSWTDSAWSQSRFGQRTVGGAVGGTTNRDAGLSQTGQITSSAAIQRDSTGFVGSSSANAANVRSQAGAATGLGGLNPVFGTGANLGAGLQFGSSLLGGGYGGVGGLGFGGLGGGFGGNTFGRQGQPFGAQGNQAGQNQFPLRAPVRIGFEPTPLAPTVVSTRFTERLSNLPGIRLVSSIEVGMEGRTAVLRGTVVSENDRDLIGRLALLEPGISEVRNELIVAPQGPPGN